MTILDHPQFKEVASNILEAAKKKYNLVLVSLPGYGVTYYLKKMLEMGTIEGGKYICDAGDELGNFNFLDFDFNKNLKALEISDRYIKTAKTDQKFVVVINTPEILKSPKYLESITSNRVFEYVYMCPMTEIEIYDLAQRCQVDLTKTEVIKMLDKTAGLSRLVKYFLLHKDFLELNLEELMNKIDFNLIFEPTVLAMYTCDVEILKKMRLYLEGKYKGTLFADYFETHPRINIQLSVDGQIVEDGKALGDKLLKHEIELLRAAVKKGGILTKEEISEVRWGDTSYEKFSDQAIKKIIQRLNDKLVKHVFEAIPTIGYRLIKK